MSILTNTLKNDKEVFHTYTIIIIRISLFHLKIINCLNSIDKKEKNSPLATNTINKEDR